MTNMRLTYALTKCIQQTVLLMPYTRQYSSSIPALPKLTLYTKEECSLCDIAKDTLQPYKHMYIFEEVDITAAGNEEWFEKYKHEIPVFHLNGQFLMKHKVNTKLLLRKLQEIEGYIEDP
ncbi:unnamed protein product [Owenia fusiformis]|uniref:Glutaredoxin-like protein n=1 Tax=Owenia fusiformis TaxID=6347 RepID=A0A8J1TX73_OWEFU|nr:unnamed protein product [Owenia fusiformis]